MLETKFLYLALMLFSLSYPLAQSFEWRLKLYTKWKFIFPAIFFMMLLFIPWDIWFTYKGIWWFSDTYTLGIKFFELPIEEWMFFVIVPYACLFIYEVLNYFIKQDIFKPFARSFFGILGIVLLVFSFLNFHRNYTFFTFLLCGISLFILVWKNPIWIGRFLLAYLVVWIPFLIINSALTGAFTENPVVNYDNTQNLGIRIFTIPIEDSVYNLLKFLMVIAAYHFLQNRTKVSQPI